MSMAHDKAVEALKTILWELPAEFSHDDPSEKPINRGFQVIAVHHSRKVHRALWELQEYLGITEE